MLGERRGGGDNEKAEYGSSERQNGQAEGKKQSFKKKMLKMEKKIRKNRLNIQQLKHYAYAQFVQQKMEGCHLEIKETKSNKNWLYIEFF